MGKALAREEYFEEAAKACTKIPVVATHCTPAWAGDTFLLRGRFRKVTPRQYIRDARGSDVLLASLSPMTIPEVIFMVTVREFPIVDALDCVTLHPPVLPSKISSCLVLLVVIGSMRTNPSTARPLLLTSGGGSEP